MSEARPKLYLLDVEGTIAPLTLTTEVLFPYARRHFALFLERHRNDETVREDLSLLEAENRSEVGEGVPRLPAIARGGSACPLPAEVGRLFNGRKSRPNPMTDTAEVYRG